MPPINLDGLPSDLPDLDALTDAGTEFSFQSIGEQMGVKCFALASRNKSSKVVTFDARHVKSAADCLERLPAIGEYIHIVIGQTFVGFDLLPAMLQLSGAAQFDELYLISLSISRDNLAQLETMICAGQVIPAKLSILLSQYFRSGQSGLWDVAKLMAAERGFILRSIQCHSKIILARLAGAYYVVESSANLCSCHSIEQFVMTQSKAVFEFHVQWVKQAIEHAKV